MKLWSTKNVIHFTYLFFLHDVRSPFVIMTLPFYSFKGMSSLSLRQQLFEINDQVHCFFQKVYIGIHDDSRETLIVQLVLIERKIINEKHGF